MSIVVIAAIYSYVQIGDSLGGWYADNLCRPDTPVDYCYLEYREELFYPVSQNALWLYGLFGLLLFMPAKVLRRWWLYVGSWSIPGMVAFTLISDEPEGGYLPRIYPESVAFAAILFVLAVTGLFIGIQLWRAQSSKKQ